MTKAHEPKGAYILMVTLNLGGTPDRRPQRTEWEEGGGSSFPSTSQMKLPPHNPHLRSGGENRESESWVPEVQVNL